MNRVEFLAQLKEALEGQIPAGSVESNLAYYREYFEESNQSEEAVCDELGDPRLIARTIIDTFGGRSGNGFAGQEHYQESTFTNSYAESVSEEQEEGLHWYDKLAGYGLMILFAAIVIVVLYFVLKVAITIVIPVVLVLIIIKLILDFFRRY